RFLYSEERIVRCNRSAMLARLVRYFGNRRHQRVGIGERLIAQTKRMAVPEQIGDLRRDNGLDHWLDEGPVERQVDLGDACGGRKAPLVFGGIAAEGANIIERARLAPHDPVAGGKIRIGAILGPALEGSLVESRRQYVDQIDIGGKLAVFL